MKNELVYCRINDLEFPEIESICLEIINKHEKPFLVCALYRPPNTSKHLNKNFLQIFETFLSKVTREKKIKEVIIVVNANYLDNSNEKPFKELVALNGFIQTVKGPTRN